MMIADLDKEEILDKLFSIPLLGFFQLSPDRKSIAWNWSTKESDEDIYYKNLDKDSKIIRLTNTKKDTYLLDWTADSKSILVCQDNDGDERIQLFLVNISEPGKMIPLTEPNPNYYIESPEIHPNNKWIIYGANYNFETKKEIDNTWIYKHHIESGESDLLAKTKSPGGGIPNLNKQGTHILYNKKDLNPSGNQLWLMDIDGSNNKEILNFGEDVKVYGSWFEDGKRILFIVELEDYKKVGIFNRENENIEWLIDDPKRNIEFAFAPYQSDYIVIGEIENTVMKPYIINKQTREEIKLNISNGNLIPVAQLENKWIGEYYNSVSPSDIVEFSLDNISNSLKSVTSMWNTIDFNKNDFIPAENLEWESVDGLKIQGWLYKTKNPKGTIVSVHGGPTAHDEDDFNITTQFYLSQGFNVFKPNYRGSTGFNLEFENSIKKDGWGGLEQEDIKTGIETLIKKKIAVPGKIGIIGTSYGGYSSWCAITRYPTNIIKAAIPICGMTDLIVDYNTTRPDIRPYSEEMMGGSPKEILGKYKERSPINFIDNITGNLMIVQGLNDPNVTTENVNAVEKELNKHGIPYEKLTFKDEGHGIGKTKNRKTLLLETVEFFEKSFN